MRVTKELPEFQSNINDPKELTARLLQENSPDDLPRLESLLEKGIISEKDVIDQLIYDWSKHIDGSTQLNQSPIQSRNLYLQYEGLRDGDQIGAPGIGRLSSRLDIAKQIFLKLPAYGVKVADLGMPISGSTEIQKILTMVQFIHDENLPIVPAVAGRTHPDDVAAIVEVGKYVKNHFDERILVYSFVGSSRIRMLAQGQNKWNIDSIKSWLSQTIDSLKRQSSIEAVIVPFEDTFGSYPQDLNILFRTALDSGADGICICDTCSRGVIPAASRNLIKYIKSEIAPDYPNAIWEIHTHNMLGNAVTNALTSYQEGLISGVHVTLGGVGDLGGNTPLEEFVRRAKINALMSEKIDNHELDSLVDIALSARNISRDNNPFGSIYSDASRYVPSGVHASAFKRLGEVGPNLRKIFELVYFPQSPTSLGLDIRLAVVTPISGTANVEAMAAKLGASGLLSEDKVNTALKLARLNQRPLTDEEFISIMNS